VWHSDINATSISSEKKEKYYSEKLDLISFRQMPLFITVSLYRARQKYFKFEKYKLCFGLLHAVQRRVALFLSSTAERKPQQQTRNISRTKRFLRCFHVDTYESWKNISLFLPGGRKYLAAQELGLNVKYFASLKISLQRNSYRI